MCPYFTNRIQFALLEHSLRWAFTWYTRIWDEDKKFVFFSGIETHTEPDSIAVLQKHKRTNTSNLPCLCKVLFSFWYGCFFYFNNQYLGFKAWLLMDAIIDSKWPIAIDMDNARLHLYNHLCTCNSSSKLIEAWLIQQPIEYIGESVEYLGVRSLCPFQLLIPDCIFDF